MIALARTPWRPGLVTLLVSVSAFAALSLLVSVGLEVHFTRTLSKSAGLVADLAHVRREAMTAILATHELAAPTRRPREPELLARSRESYASVQRRLDDVEGEARARAPWLRPRVLMAGERWRAVTRAALALAEPDAADSDRAAFVLAAASWNEDTARAFDDYIGELTVMSHRFLRIALVDLAVSLGLIAGGAVLAHALIVKPLRALGSALASVARADYSPRLELRGTAEVEELTRSFNVMLAALAERDARISSQSTALAERNRALLAANAELDHFAYAASHDLRAPLRGVDSMARFLEEDWGSRLDERSRGYLARIRRAAQRLDRLINDLLEVARAGRALGPTESVALSEVLREALESLSESARAAGAEIHVRRLDDLPPVRGDRLRLVLVLQNLLANAVKYSSGPGRRARVEVSGSREGDRVLLAVKDNGIGISADQLERVFGLFKRLHRDGYEGTGVGLAIVKRIVEAHGGKVWVESTVGAGSTFFVELPVASAVAATAPVMEAP